MRRRVQMIPSSLSQSGPQPLACANALFPSAAWAAPCHASSPYLRRWKGCYSCLTTCLELCLHSSLQRACWSECWQGGLSGGAERSHRESPSNPLTLDNQPFRNLSRQCFSFPAMIAVLRRSLAQLPACAEPARRCPLCAAFISTTRLRG